LQRELTATLNYKTDEHSCDEDTHKYFVKFLKDYFDKDYPNNKGDFDSKLIDDMQIKVKSISKGKVEIIFSYNERNAYANEEFKNFLMGELDDSWLIDRRFWNWLEDESFEDEESEDIIDTILYDAFIYQYSFQLQ